MRTASVLALAATAAAQAHQGFNYGSTFTTGAAKQQSDFESEFTAAKNLAGTNGAFTSARLYTTVQGGTASDPISAIPAAIKTKTGLLLGLWASAGDTAFANELQALKSAISTYGSDFTSLVQGISVGSEDLYRNSPQGIAAGSFVGANPDTVANYIKEVRSLIAGTGLSGAPIGHVDTWTAWVNGSNAAVYDACDWVGMDAYPYFEDTVPNAISEGKSLFSSALGKTSGATGKPVWITETGWPVSGKTVGSAVPSLENAKTFWDEVGCPMFGSTNVWWYTLQDASPDTPNPSFGLVGNSLTSSPVFDLSCSNVTKASSSASTSGAASSTIAASSSATGSGSGAATTSVPAGGESNGSPGLTGLSSQLSIEASSTPTLSLSLGGSTATATGSGSAVTTYASGTGSGSGSGAGANSTIATTVKTGTTIAPTSTSTIVPANAGTVMQAGSLGAAVVAIMAAIFAL